MPTIMPYPSQRFIRLDRASGLPGMNTATAAGSPEQNTVQPPKTVAQASRTLTIAVPSEGLTSQRMRMTAVAGMQITVLSACDETLGFSLHIPGSPHKVTDLAHSVTKL